MAAEVNEVSELLCLPEELMNKILSYLPYEGISNARLTCKTFDQTCQQLLNQGFSKVDKFHAFCQREVKNKLPRRESERRNHPLARHVDILAAIETRLSLLGMTFMKYVDMGLCCFIPGKVLDEILRVLHFIQSQTSPPRAHELLQELRDISSMAMEHFDEKIVPGLRKKIPVALSSPLNSSFSKASSGSATMSTVPGPSFLTNSTPVGSGRLPNVRQDIARINHNMRVNSSSVISVKKELNDCRTKLSEYNRRLLEQDKRVNEQRNMINEQSKKITEQDKKINELSKKIIEYDQKFEDLMAEISRVRTSGESVVASLPGISTAVDPDGSVATTLGTVSPQERIQSPVASRTRKRKIPPVDAKWTVKQSKTAKTQHT